MLEQMYLITVPKISVLGPNYWETTTEFFGEMCLINAGMNAGVHVTSVFLLMVIWLNVRRFLSRNVGIGRECWESSIGRLNT